MSADARDALWGRWPSSWSPAVKLAALGLADVVNDMHGNRFYASVGALAGKVGLADSTVRDALAELEADGWLEVIERRPGQATIYRWTPPNGGGVTPPNPGDHPAEPRRGTPPNGGDLNRSEPKGNRAPPVDNRVEPSSRFPTNRTADRAACSLCADTGWATNDDGHAFRCQHPAFARRPPAGQAVNHPADAARRLREIIDQRAGATTCPDPTMSSSTPAPSPTSS